ncbi:MAG: DUF1080 domain-containing protein [Lentisphaeria bacterium]|nr:DUF1080 domain-containing protein [Lentisphaeria bacterium]
MHASRPHVLPALLALCCLSLLALLSAMSAPAAETAGEWKALFDGTSLDAWTCKPGGWTIEDGAVALQPKGGYLWSKERFGDFVLDLEFKVDSGTNSGIFIRTDRTNDPVQTGIEVQVFDSHGKPTGNKHMCGAIYDCLSPSANPMKPAGEWNHMVITCQANVIRIVLNETPIIDMDLDQWTTPNQNPDGSKNKFKTAYKDMPRAGHIGFQDHGKPVWYRNIRIRPL